MSTWTHVAGLIRVDNLSRLFSVSQSSKDLSEIFIKSTWDQPNESCNLPKGSEGSLDVEIITRNEEGMEYMQEVAIWGDLRDYDSVDCEKIKEWWANIPEKLGKMCSIRNAVLLVSPEDGKVFILTEEDMNLLETN